MPNENTDTEPTTTTETPPPEPETTTETAEPDQFPRKYVEGLRKEAAEHRTRAADRDAIAQRLQTTLIAQTGRLVEGAADLVPYDEALLTDPDALSAALSALLEARPYLAEAPERPPATSARAEALRRPRSACWTACAATCDAPGGRSARHPAPVPGEPDPVEDHHDGRRLPGQRRLPQVRPRGREDSGSSRAGFPKGRGVGYGQSESRPPFPVPHLPAPVQPQRSRRDGAGRQRGLVPGGLGAVAWPQCGTPAAGARLLDMAALDDRRRRDEAAPGRQDAARRGSPRRRRALAEGDTQMVRAGESRTGHGPFQPLPVPRRNPRGGPRAALHRCGGDGGTRAVPLA